MTRRFWTREEDELLRSIYPSIKTPEVAKALNRSVCAVYGHTELLGVKKSAAYLAEKKREEAERLCVSGKAHRYPKGSIPLNKGLRRPGWAVGRMRETQFKKGQRVYNQRNVGDTRLVDGYLYTKVSEIPLVPWTRNWRQTHYVLWEKVHGPIPSGHKLCFKDGNRKHVALDNLELRTDGDVMRENTMHNLPPAIREVIHLKGAINRAITMRGRKRNGEEQTQRSA